MGQFQLAHGVVAQAHQFLDDLQKKAGRVFFQLALGREENLVPKRSQGLDAVPGHARLQGPQEVDDGVGDAQFPGSGHFLDAVGMQVGGQKTPQAREFLAA